uniref:Uncharacterized protein n=1 Tax=Cacopsylla melanoneura TaxID=428564 RepID=A0A8D8T1J9_9HEMI
MKDVCTLQSTQVTFGHNCFHFLSLPLAQYLSSSKTVFANILHSLVFLFILFVALLFSSSASWPSLHSASSFSLHLFIILWDFLQKPPRPPKRLSSRSSSAKMSRRVQCRR